MAQSGQSLRKCDTCSMGRIPIVPHHPVCDVTVADLSQIRGTDEDTNLLREIGVEQTVVQVIDEFFLRSQGTGTLLNQTDGSKP